MYTNNQKLRLLYLPVESTEGDQRARRKILAEMVTENKLEALKVFSYRIFGREHGWRAMEQEILKIAREFDATAIYWHGIWDGDLNEKNIQAIKELKNRPVLCTDNGDAFGNWWVAPYPKSFKELLKFADISFTVGLGRQADFMYKSGAKHVHLLPSGFDETSFNSVLSEKTVSVSKENDLVMIANSWKSRRPFASMPGVKARNELVKALYEEFGNGFALYGKGWDKYPLARGPIDFFKQTDAFNKSKIAIGLPNFYDIDYYDSNRPFNTIGSGIPYISGNSPKFDEILQDSVHCHYFKTPAEAIDKVKWLLTLDDKERTQMGINAARYVRKHHSIRNRMNVLVSTLEKVWAYKHLGSLYPSSDTSFLFKNIKG